MSSSVRAYVDLFIERDAQVIAQPSAFAPDRIRVGLGGEVTVYLSPDAARALVEQVTAALAEHDATAGVSA